MKTRNSRGPKTVPWGTPLRTWMLSDVALEVFYCDLLNSICEKCPDPF